MTPSSHTAAPGAGNRRTHDFLARRAAWLVPRESRLWHSSPDGTPLVRETKTAGRRTHLRQAAAILRSMALEDERYPRGVVESVYFDGPGLDAYREKANGDLFKRKVRIRWYSVPGRPDATTAFLEIKDRAGAGRAKARVAFAADPVFLRTAPLGDRRWTDLLRRRCMEAGIDVPDDRAPSIAVRYSRLRFTCPLTGARISLDYGIEASRVNNALLRGGPLGLDAIVCEAKSATARHWPWDAPLRQIGMRPASFSKYGALVSRLIER